MCTCALTQVRVRVGPGNERLQQRGLDPALTWEHGAHSLFISAVPLHIYLDSSDLLRLYLDVYITPPLRSVWIAGG